MSGYKLIERPMHERIPENPERNRKGWKFPYQGDDLPGKSCWCWTYTIDRKVRRCYWDAKKQEWKKKNNDIVAYRVEQFDEAYSGVEPKSKYAEAKKAWKK